MKTPGRAVTGLAIGAAGMLYSRLSGRRPQQDQQPRPQPGRPERPEVAPDEVERARTELADELARRAGSTFPT